MNHLERVFSQGDASRLSGVPADILRDWRRRGFLDFVGEQGANGRWSYNFKEILELAIVRMIEGNGQSIKTLLYMASRLSLMVTAEFRRDDPDYDGWWRGYIAFLFDANGKLSIDIRVADTIAGLGDITELHPQAIIVDSVRLAKAMPEAIKLLLASETEAE